MKYITRNIQNEIVLKLNSTPVNTFSGTYLWNCKHIQTSAVLTLILADQSPAPHDNYQKFIITSGDSNNFLLGQYEVKIYDITASTTLITTEYITAKTSSVDDAIYFMANSDTADVYEMTNTSIPSAPVGLTATLQPSGDQINLQWQLGSTNSDSFEIWRAKGTGNTVQLVSGVQSYIYLDQYLDFNTQYKYKIRAKNNIGYSSFTQEVTAVTSYSATTATTAVYLIGSGGTITSHISGNTWIINSIVPSGITVHWGNIVGTLSGQTDLWQALQGKAALVHVHNQYATVIALTGHSSNISLHTPYSAITALIASATSGLTSSWSGLTGLPTDNNDLVVLLSHYSLTGHNHTGVYSPVNHLHTGVYSLTGHSHTTLTGLTINQSQVNGLVSALAGKSSTGHTHSYTGSSITNKPSFVGSGETIVQLVGNTYRIYSPTVSTADWLTLTNRPQWLSGTTLGAFEAQHAHASLYPTKAQITTYTGTTAPLQFAPKSLVNSFTGHSGNTIIHFTKASINLDDLGNVTVPSPVNLDYLRYNSGTTAWINEAPTDIFASVTDGYLLRRNGTAVAGMNPQGFAALSGATFTGALGSNALFTGSLGANISGAIIYLNQSSNFGVSIANGTSTGVVNVATGSTTQTINLGTGAGIKTVTLGSNNSTSVTNILGGSVGIRMNVGVNGGININGGTGAIYIGSGATTQTIQLGAGAGIKTLTLGSTNSSSISTLQSGTGGISIQSTGVGTVGINTSTQTGTVTIGGTGIMAIAVGDSTGVKTITIGSHATPANAISIGGANSTTTFLGIHNINNNTNVATNINYGTSTGKITLGGEGIQSIAVGDSTGVKTITIGSHATPANSIAIGGTNSTTTLGGTVNITDSTDIFANVTDLQLLRRNGTAVTGYTLSLLATAASVQTYTGTTAPASYKPLYPTLKTVTGTTYTALSADVQKNLEFTNTGATTITLVTGLTSQYEIRVINIGGQTITFAAGGGATVNSKAGNLKLATQYTTAQALYRGSNKWLVISNDLTA